VRAWDYWPRYAQCGLTYDRFLKVRALRPVLPLTQCDPPYTQPSSWESVKLYIFIFSYITPAVEVQHQRLRGGG
jgi:hypothetical protein